MPTDPEVPPDRCARRNPLALLREIQSQRQQLAKSVGTLLARQWLQAERAKNRTAAGPDVPGD